MIKLGTYREMVKEKELVIGRSYFISTSGLMDNIHLAMYLGINQNNAFTFYLVSPVNAYVDDCKDVYITSEYEYSVLDKIFKIIIERTYQEYFLFTRKSIRNVVLAECEEANYEKEIKSWCVKQKLSDTNFPVFSEKHFKPKYVKKKDLVKGKLYLAHEDDIFLYLGDNNFVWFDISIIRWFDRIKTKYDYVNYAVKDGRCLKWDFLPYTLKEITYYTGFHAEEVKEVVDKWYSL